jgi:hypothetical protein
VTAKKTHVLFCNHTGCAATFTTDDDRSSTVGGVRRAAAAVHWTHGAIRTHNGVAWASGDWCPDHRDAARAP